MDRLVNTAVEAWKAADLAAQDAEGLVRVQLIKYAEGISGPPTRLLIERTEELRHASNQALVAAMHLLSAVKELKHLDCPHPTVPTPLQ